MSLPTDAIRQDDRGFQKAEMQIMNPREANFQETVNLVERNPCPNGVALVDPDRVGKKTQFDLVELAAEIQKADHFTRATAGSKLSVIAEQVRFLQEQAAKVLEDAQRNAELNHIACNFKKIPGKTYYVYKKPDINGRKYMSMISPEEWGANVPEFVAAYKLEYDMTWTPFDKIEQRQDENLAIDKILKAGSQLQLTFS
ncbi:hypothetical protein TCAL_12104 [Tigriopus californicus]|uniref:DUF2452 domain-containing protein n=1 Tax=Tigriopus californicus TaxID=6832 RepID=A0A553PQN1_TIGCA|nr:uncharacterized protein C1orf50 homolog [Tigriopus californicus]TRY79993.1 hypothetical protein TCAL_12104 [Tigriopus californicus]|eukprot:TCALIF_12104-PA protein Name:"Similar to Uncharacterized protein C1orf50 homolog (Xenopus laevis)" AED:0.10 eAED:0.10 QI:132/1/1/1/1/1/4/96/198